MPRRANGWVWRYGVAALGTALAVWARLLMDPYFGGQFPFLGFLIVVLICGWYGGFGPAVASIALGSLAAVMIFVRSHGWLGSDRIDFQIGLGLFILVGTVSALLNESLRTARLRAEAGAAESKAAWAEAAARREWLRVTLASIGDAVVAVDGAGRVNYLNPVAEALIGRSAKEAEGVPHAEVFQIRREERGGPALDLFAHAIQEGKRISPAHATVLVTRDGGQRPIEANASPIRDERGQAVGAVLIFRDISERRRADRTARFLAEAGATLAELVDYERALQKVAGLAVPFFADWCAVDMVEADGSTRRVAVGHIDPAKVELTRELDRRYPRRTDAPYGVAHVLRTGRAELAAEITDEMLVATARDENHLRTLRQLGLKSYICVPLVSRSRILGAITFLMGSSGRRYGPGDLVVAEDLACRATTALENSRLFREVREADRRKDEFLAMLGHELRNPLAPVRNGVHILRGSVGDPAETVRTLDMMERQVGHLTRLVDDLLDVSRIMKGKIELRKEPVELSALVARAVETVQPLVQEQGQDLTVSLPGEAVWLEADMVRAAQVLSNLLHNAVKYTDRAGRVRLEAGRDGDEVVLRVQDTGVGIAAEMLPRIFGLFVQSERSLDRANGGLGVGLTLVKILVELHGGTVTAHSPGPGRGSTFTVRLPAVCPGGRAAPAPEKGPEPAPRRRVLIIDDNRDTAESLGTMVRLWGHEARVCYDGADALASADEFLPEVAVIDIGLPGLNGYDVAGRLRRHPALGGTVLIALTGYGQEEDRRLSRVAGFDQHLVKPVEPDVLRRALLFTP